MSRAFLSIHTIPATRAITALVLLAVSFLLMLTGCQHETAANPAPDPTGVYALVSVDGQPTPCTIYHEGTATTVQSGSFTIATAGHRRDACAASENFF